MPTPHPLPDSSQDGGARGFRGRCAGTAATWSPCWTICRGCSRWRCSSGGIVRRLAVRRCLISFRTADNLVHGYGLTWNVQERVQAYTHPLWLLLFSGVYWITREAYHTAIFLSLAVSRRPWRGSPGRLPRRGSAAVLGVLMLTVSVAFVDYSTSGLENPLTHLMLVLFLWLYLTAGDDRGRT